MALVSDAGTPLVNDPGFRLVREAVEAGLAVHPIPGPSSVLAALTLAGLPTDRFLFAGFLPPKSGARRSFLEELRPVRASLVLFETGPRLRESLQDMAAVLGPRAGGGRARADQALRDLRARRACPSSPPTRGWRRPRARSSW